MSLEIDTRRAFLSPAARRALVRAVRDAPTHESEPDWLEWKGLVDLTEKRWLAEIARHAIGFANRDPTSAQRAAEGFGYLLLGVEPGNPCGVVPIDTAQLESGTAPYLGRDGPQLSPEYLDVEGIVVLVITVQPPRWGDRIYAFEKEFQHETGGIRSHYKNGDIFVRRNGRTERASTAEIRMLERRLLPRTAPGLNIDLVWWEQEGAIVPIDVSGDWAANWIEEERRALQRPRETAVPPPPPSREQDGVTIGDLLANQWEPETRTSAEYDQEVEEYLEKAHEQLRPLLHLRTVQLRVAVVQLGILNRSDDNYREVFVELSFNGAVAAYSDEAEAKLKLDFPKKPKAWGPRRKPRETTIPQSALPFTTSTFMPNTYTPLQRQLSIDNSGSTRIRFDPVDLRPRYQVSLPELHLVAEVGSDPLGHVVGEWVGTSTSVSGLSSGSFAVPLREAVPALQVLRRRQ